MKYIITWQKVSWSRDDTGGMKRSYLVSERNFPKTYDLTSSRQIGEAKIFYTRDEARLVLKRVRDYAESGAEVQSVEDKTLFDARLKGV